MIDLYDLAGSVLLDALLWIWRWSGWIAIWACVVVLVLLFFRGVAKLNGRDLEGGPERDDAIYYGPESSHALREMPPEQPRPVWAGADSVVPFERKRAADTEGGE